MTKRGLAHFLPKVLRDPRTGCWNWIGFRNPCGYGRCQRALAHRVAYEHWVGPIPIGKEIDHLCRNRACVNPSHLEAVEHRVNVIRGNGPKAAKERLIGNQLNRGVPHTLAARMKMSAKRIGALNGRAVPVIYEGVRYGCIKDCVIATGISREMLLRSPALSKQMVS